MPVRAPSRLKLALSMDLGHMAVDEEVQSSVRAAVERLRASGATLEEVDLDWPAEIVQCAVDHWKVYLAAFFGQHLEQFRDCMDPYVVELMEQARSISAVDYKRMEILRSECWYKLLRILSEYDALLSPTATTTAPPVGSGYTHFVGTTEDGRVKGLELTAAFNLMAQCPALSVPIGFSDQESALLPAHHRTQIRRRGRARRRQGDRESLRRISSLSTVVTESGDDTRAGSRFGRCRCRSRRWCRPAITLLRFAVCDPQNLDGGCYVARGAQSRRIGLRQ